MTVYRSEIAVFVSPFVPDPHSVLLKILDIGISCNEPEEFIYDGFQVKFLGGQKRKALPEVKAHLMSEHALRTNTRTVRFHRSVLADMA